MSNPNKPNKPNIYELYKPNFKGPIDGTVRVPGVTPRRSEIAGEPLLKVPMNTSDMPQERVENLRRLGGETSNDEQSTSRNRISRKGIALATAATLASFGVSTDTGQQASKALIEHIKDSPDRVTDSVERLNSNEQPDQRPDVAGFED